MIAPLVGLRGTAERTITAQDIAAYCAATGDDDPLHVDVAFATASSYGAPIAPGGLVIGVMMAAAVATTGNLGVPVTSVGFDRVRHTAPVYVGDALRADYEIVSLAGERGHAAITVVNQDGDTVGVADHVFQVLA